MNQEKSSTGKWVEGVTDLTEAYRNLITLRIVEYTSIGGALSIMGTLLMITVVFVLLFTGIGSAWWLGEYLRNMKAGFFIVGGFYSLLFILLILTSRKVWIPRLRNFIIKKIYEQN